MNKESYFISRFKDSHIGDDGAVVGNLLYSMDAFFENVHFKREWMSLKQIAKKAMLVNISDAIAMNATPKQALLTVAMPKSISPAEMNELAEGFQEAADQFGIEIIGGDTIANIKLDISVTIISECKNPLRRDTLKRGDLLAYTGDLGSSKKDLKKLLSGGKVPATSKFITPVLRERFVREAAPYLSGGMDISDGLFTELGRLSSQNRMDFRFFHKIGKEIGCSGEEYEMLISFNPKHKWRIMQIARRCRIPLTIFGKTVRGRYKNRCKKHHF